MIMISMTLLSTNSCENRQQITGPKQESFESLDAQLDELEQEIAELSESLFSDNITVYSNSANPQDGPCCNNNYPSSTDPNAVHDLRVCENDPDEIFLSAKECAMTWARYNLSIHSSLGYKACGKSVHLLSVPNITGLTKAQAGNNPYFTWNFMYCNKYRIERKIGNGSWNFLVNINPTDYNHPNHPTTQYYRDTSINLNTITQNIYYRVKGDIYDQYSNGGQTIVYNPPPVLVTISGPSRLKSGRSGTFTAKVIGGVPSTYSYQWSKYQYCNDLDNINSDIGEAVACGYWRPTGGNSKTLYAAGARPKFKLKCTVTDINGSSTDSHTIWIR